MGKILLTLEIIIFFILFIMALIDKYHNKDLSVFNAFILIILMIHIDNRLNKD